MNNRINIYILGNTNNYLDEAQKNITKRLTFELSKLHEVKYENAKENILRRCQ